MPTERKVTQVAELRELIREAEIAISTAYQGISVADQVELRAALSGAGAQMRVVKNTLLRIAARQAGLEQFASLADGPTALVVGRDEPISAARAIAEYLRTRPNSPVKIRSAVVSGQLVDAAYVQDLATVPPREELLARLAGSLIGQVTQLAMLLQATTREFAGLIEARAAQLEGSGGG
ncbi:MAG: 50S ribosomal protein L10 [Chloroflexi bacterium]|nr:50S ribosomal protein L10 [Chloroflexota bacterium]